MLYRIVYIACSIRPVHIQGTVMARKRKQRTVLPVHLQADLYDRVKEAAAWEAQRIKVETFGASSLARQGIALRVEQIEADRKALEAA